MKNIILLIITLLHCLITSLTIGQVVSPTPNSPGAGNCLSFNVSGDLVRLNTDYNLTTNFTIEGWIQVNSNDGGFFFHIPFTTTNNTSIDMFVNTTLTVRHGFNTAPVTTSPTSITNVSDGGWYHFASTYDGANHRLYINGVLESTIPHTGNVRAGNLNMTAIGSIFLITGDNWLNCQLDDFRIWTSVRTQAEIRDNMCHTLMGTEPNLVGYWQMDAMGSTCGGATQVCDMTGNGNNGTLN